MLRTFQGSVYPWQCDFFGHMNVQFYVHMFDQANNNLFSAAGLTRDYFKANNRGMAGLEQHIRYLKELFPGDNVYIHSVIELTGPKVVTCRHWMHVVETDEPCAECTIVAVHLDSVARKAAALPEQITAVIAGMKGGQS